MKRATLSWVKTWVDSRDQVFRPEFIDILDSEKRLKAEVRRLRAVIVRVRNGLEDSGWEGPKWAHEFIVDALRPAKRGAK